MRSTSRGSQVGNDSEYPSLFRQLDRMTDFPNSKGARVGICVATFRRPGRLRKLMKGLVSLSFRHVPVPNVVVVVADNDPELGEAAQVCKEFEHGRWPIIYTPEPHRGISYARNAAVKTAIESGAEWIAFIDDDEVPLPFWLDELLYLSLIHI